LKFVSSQKYTTKLGYNLQFFVVLTEVYNNHRTKSYAVTVTM